MIIWGNNYFHYPRSCRSGERVSGQNAPPSMYFSRGLKSSEVLRLLTPYEAIVRDNSLHYKSVLMPTNSTTTTIRETFGRYRG